MYPVELLLIIVSYLPTRDIVVLGHTCKHLRDICEDERKKRQDIDRLLRHYVDDTQRFRRLMRDTGAIIVGDLARAFFTGEDPPKRLELLFHPRLRSDINIWHHRWNSVFGKTVDELPLQKVNCDNHWTEEVSRYELSLI
jgi:hypothetical protein